MASPKIIPKKSVQSAKIPLSTDLESGEICINHADKILYAKHPGTGAIQEIGSLSAHSHDELYSLNGTQHLELQNNGDLTLPNGGTISDSAVAEGSITLTPPNATAGQGLVIRPTVGVSLTNDVGFSAGAAITVTLTDAGSHISDDWTANGGKDANWAYTITGITTGNLGSALTGTFAAGDWFISGGNYINTKIFNIPAGSTGTGFSIRLDDPITSAYSGYPTPPNLELTIGATSTLPETGHLHLVTADQTNVDLYLGDDYQFVKIERNSGGIVIGNNNNTHQWNFKTDGTLELPAGGDITISGSSVLGGGGGGVQANWNSTSGASSILNKPTLATVATSGSYTDLSSKPTLGTAAATAATDYATAAQGTTADSALQASALTPYRTSAAQDTIDAGKATSAQGAKADSALQASALTPYRTSAAQDTIDAGFAASTHTHAASDITSGTLNDSRLSANVVLTSDARLSNARTPTNHASTHATGGTDAISPSSIGAAASSHQHPLSDFTQSSATTGQVVAWNGTAWAPSTPAASGVSSVAGRTGAVTLAVADVANAVGSVTTGIANTTPITNMMQITSAGYSAITPAANTLYIIVG